jgi:uncharacterized membrane protein
MSHIFRLAKVPTQLALLGACASLLSACGGGTPHFVHCAGVPLGDKGDLYIDKGICKKLAGNKPKSLKCSHWVKAKGEMMECTDAHSTLTAKNYKVDDYVKCYGVADASMNDCGTSSTACGGSVSVARASDAWIAIPKGICERIQGAKIGQMKK